MQRCRLSRRRDLPFLPTVRNSFTPLLSSLMPELERRNMLLVQSKMLRSSLLVFFVCMAYTVLATPFAVSGTQPLILSSSFSAPDSLGNQSIKLFNASAENDIGVHCDGGTYGFSPNVADCETGQYQIPGDTEVFQFVERPNAAGNDLPLPFRLLGGMPPVLRFHLLLGH